MTPKKCLGHIEDLKRFIAVLRKSRYAPDNHLLLNAEIDIDFIECYIKENANDTHSHNTTTTET